MTFVLGRQSPGKVQIVLPFLLNYRLIREAVERAREFQLAAVERQDDLRLRTVI